MSVVTVTSIETIPTPTPLSIQSIPTTNISSSKNFSVTTLLSAIKVSKSKNIQALTISTSGSIDLNENNTTNLSSSLASYFVSVIKSSPLETSSNILQKTFSSSTSSLNAISHSNPTGSSSVIAMIPASTTSRVFGSTIYTFTPSYALASSVARIDAQTSSEFSSNSTKHLGFTSCNKKTHNMVAHNSPVVINVPPC